MLGPERMASDGSNTVERGRRLFRRKDRRVGRGAGGGAGGQRGGGPAGDRRFRAAGQTAASARPLVRRAQGVGNRDSGRLFDDLARARRAGRRRGRDARGGSRSRRGRARQHCARRPRRSGDIRVGAALTSLPRIAQEGRGPFDFIFIDADKPNNPEYLAWALRLARPGAAIVCDNVVREGAVVDGAATDASVQGIRRMFDAMAKEPRLSATAIQTVGVKGWDGFAIAMVERT